MLQVVLSGIVAASTTARLFNGISDKLTSSATYLAGSTTFTLAFWFKSSDVTQIQKYIWQFGGSNGSAVIYGYVNDGSGHDQIEFYDGGDGTLRAGSQVTITDTAWHHIAYRFTSGSAWDYFLDGVKHNIGSPTYTVGTGAASNIVMSPGSSNFTEGLIARLYVSTSALSDGQISALATTGSSSGVSGTVGYWLLDGTASPEPESAPSPNSNSLTVTGTTNGQVGPSLSAT